MIERLAMGGYGAYVWSAFGISVALLLLNLWWARRRLRQALDRVGRGAGPAAQARRPVVREVGQGEA